MNSAYKFDQQWSNHLDELVLILGYNIHISISKWKKKIKSSRNLSISHRIRFITIWDIFDRWHLAYHDSQREMWWLLKWTTYLFVSVYIYMPIDRDILSKKTHKDMRLFVLISSSQLGVKSFTLRSRLHFLDYTNETIDNSVLIGNISFRSKFRTSALHLPFNNSCTAFKRSCPNNFFAWG